MNKHEKLAQSIKALEGQTLKILGTQIAPERGLRRIAEQAGVSHTWLWRWTHRKIKKISVDRLIRISAALRQDGK